MKLEKILSELEKYYIKHPYTKRIIFPEKDRIVTDSNMIFGVDWNNKEIKCANCNEINIVTCYNNQCSAYNIDTGEYGPSSPDRKLFTCTHCGEDNSLYTAIASTRKSKKLWLTMAEISEEHKT